MGTGGEKNGKRKTRAERKECPSNRGAIHGGAELMKLGGERRKNGLDKENNIWDGDGIGSISGVRSICGGTE